MRLLLPLLLFATALAAETVDAAVAAKDDLVVDRIQWYRYALNQTVMWSSVGDELTYEQSLNWTFALRPTALTDTTATLNATIIRIEAQSSGPGYERRFDSSQPPVTTDPLFGHLDALAGTTLTLTMARDSGRVTAVAGGDALIAAISARLPAAAPGQPSPFATEIAHLYSDEALARWWTALLVQPGADSPLPLLAEPAITIERRWQEAAFTLALPADSPAPRLTLVNDPTPVHATLTALSGSGEVRSTGGLPDGQTGRLDYTLTLDALTQAVSQRHAVTWTLNKVERGE